METKFAPIEALSGGALIGLSAVLLMLSIGRIAGVSGILGGAFIAREGDIGWRFAFVGGLFAAPIVMPWFGYELPPLEMVPWQGLIVAGLLVGFGTRMAGGCTSGHGICGISRVSPRSVAAICIFMATGFATVFLIRHVLGA